MKNANQTTLTVIRANLPAAAETKAAVEAYIAGKYAKRIADLQAAAKAAAKVTTQATRDAANLLSQEAHKLAADIKKDYEENGKPAHAIYKAIQEPFAAEQKNAEAIKKQHGDAVTAFDLKIKAEEEARRRKAEEEARQKEEAARREQERLEREAAAIKDKAAREAAEAEAKAAREAAEKAAEKAAAAAAKNATPVALGAKAKTAAKTREVRQIQVDNLPAAFAEYCAEEGLQTALGTDAVDAALAGFKARLAATVKGEKPPLGNTTVATKTVRVG